MEIVLRHPGVALDGDLADERPDRISVRDREADPRVGLDVGDLGAVQDARRHEDPIAPQERDHLVDDRTTGRIDHGQVADQGGIDQPGDRVRKSWH